MAFYDVRLDKRDLCQKADCTDPHDHHLVVEAESEVQAAFNAAVLVMSHNKADFMDSVVKHSPIIAEVTRDAALEENQEYTILGVCSGCSMLEIFVPGRLEKENTQEN